MKLVKFELKKLWKQKKVLWLFIILLLGTGYLYRQNESRQIGEIIKEYYQILDYDFAVLPHIERIDRALHAG